jgi:anti-sigma regulatory factor (Ser/Thr protein kinase)
MEAAVNGVPDPWRAPQGGPSSVRVPLDDLSRVGEARRMADTLARAAGLDEGARGALGVVVTEAATNLARHARAGVVLLRDTTPTGRPGVELLAVDAGPGMEDLSHVFTDGVSTGGTPGTGLGAMRRMAHELDLYSKPGQGTALVARVFAASAAVWRGERRAPLLDVGVICTPVSPETVSGDGWSVIQEVDRAAVLVVDGLGHGPSAAEAADVARDAFREVSDREPREALLVIHEALRATRGAALVITTLRRTATGATVTLAGAGNISAAVVGGTRTRALPSVNGTAGLQIRAPQQFTTELSPGEQLVFCTDGVTTRWRLDSYPGIVDRDPALLAAVIHRDCERGRDDATVMAVALRRMHDA